MYVVVRNLCATYSSTSLKPFPPAPGTSYHSSLPVRTIAQIPAANPSFCESDGLLKRWVLCNICVIECMIYYFVIFVHYINTSFLGKKQEKTKKIEFFFYPLILFLLFLLLSGLFSSLLGLLLCHLCEGVVCE